MKAFRPLLVFLSEDLQRMQTRRRFGLWKKNKKRNKIKKTKLKNVEKMNEINRKQIY